MRALLLLLAAALACAEEPMLRAVIRPAAEGGVTKLHLAPRYSTVIRLPEEIRSVVVGDPASFSAEHSELEPRLLIVKPVVNEPAETNLLISTASGQQVSLLLVSRGNESATNSQPIDFVMRYEAPGTFLVPRTAPVASATPPQPPSSHSPNPLDSLLSRQRRAAIPALQRGGSLGAGISEVLDDGPQVVAVYSVVNRHHAPVELSPPQVQLSVKKRQGLLRHRQTVSAEQLPVSEWRLSRRRLDPGQRADGIVVFSRPSYKRAHEALFLQLAETGAVDRPLLLPVEFGKGTRP